MFSRRLVQKATTLTPTTTSSAIRPLSTTTVQWAQRAKSPALADVTPAAVAELDLEVGRQVWLSAKATEVEAYADHGQPRRAGQVD